ncbi:zinc knuckle (CCHC-type) family protein [Striga hermonthica]|uniref:Zinc knuckle (CCHC-type) family protein n=1 Tax=Striga hermonthica TaxID=68872 RepID=A0A9N7NRM4_STRHE|nr:zinc knuckle (CCHC-type) family protein [Striga hermonthica]
MYTVWSSSCRTMDPHRRLGYNNNFRFWVLPRSNRRLSFLLSSSGSHDNSPPSKQPPLNLGYDPSEELFGISVDLQPRKVASPASKKSWFGPNGLYIRELPCPSCRGRGYTPCAECGIERSRSDCSLCNGKGIVTCKQCNGDCVVWEESIDEQPWEKARSVSPLKVKEDDEVDNLDIKLDMKKKKKRVYRSPTAEINLKISRSLKSLNAKTGIFSKRMKLIHKDPVLHAQRVAAIKKTKGTADARKRASEAMKSYFSDPENRRKRSISMKGIKFFCRKCGGEGHRRNYCPQAIDRRSVPRWLAVARLDRAQGLLARQFMSKRRPCWERSHGWTGARAQDKQVHEVHGRGAGRIGTGILVHEHALGWHVGGTDTNKGAHGHWASATQHRREPGFRQATHRSADDSSGSPNSLDSL